MTEWEKESIEKIKEILELFDIPFYDRLIDKLHKDKQQEIKKLGDALNVQTKDGWLDRVIKGQYKSRGIE